jgi:hypothetical protein
VREKANEPIGKIFSGIRLADLFKSAILLHPDMHEGDNIARGIQAAIGQIELFIPFGSFKDHPSGQQQEVALRHRHSGTKYLQKKQYKNQESAVIHSDIFLKKTLHETTPSLIERD